MNAKDIAQVLFWTSMVSAITIADADCDCNGYGIKNSIFCFDNVMDFTWDDASLIDVVNFGEANLSPAIRFIGKWATCSFIESIGKKIPVIQTCPSNFTGSIDILGECESQGNTIPLVDYNRGFLKITFQNIFCAQCHGINEYLMDHVISWYSDFKCSLNGTCQVQYDPPPTRLNICNYTRIKKNTINSEWPACKSNDTAACFTINFLKYELVGFLSVCSGSTDVGTDITTLFRFPAQEVRKVRINGKVTRESLICEDDESYDRYILTCRQFVCPAYYYPKQGQCQPNMTIYLSADTQPFPIPKDLLTLNISIILTSFIDSNFTEEILKNINLLYPIQWIKSIRVFSDSWKLTLIKIEFNLTDSFLEDFLRILSDVTLILNNGKTVEFNVNNHVPRESISCPQESYALICLDKAELGLQKDTLFTGFVSNNRTIFVPLENTHYEIKLVHPISTMELISVCLCQPLTVKLDLNCSTKLYKFNENEYTINIMDETLEVSSYGIKVANSSFIVDSNGTALVCFEAVPTSFKPFLNYDATISYFSWACSLISVAFQLATIILFALFPELRNLSSKITTGLSVSMILAQLGLHMPRISMEFCQGIAFITHFNWLSAFAWMTSQAINMFATFHPKTQSKATGWHDGKAFRKYALVCLTIPLVIVSLFFTLDMIPGEHMHSGYGQATCGWFANQSTYIYGFFVPVGLSVLLNIIFFCLTLYHIEKTLSNTTRVTGKARNRNTCIIYIKLTSVMGLSWIVGFIASVVNNHGLWFVYLILNGLQGVFIFVSFSVNARVRQLLKSKLKGSNYQSSQTKESTVTT